MTGLSAVEVAGLPQDLVLRLTVEAFQNRELALLQDGRFEEWLTLMTPDVRYWMPVVANREQREEQVSREGELTWFDDGYDALALRVRRLGSGLAVDETPPSRFRYFVQNLEIASNGDAEIAIRSNLLIYRTRRENQESYFVGGREDTLRRVDGEWKLARRKVLLDRTVLGPNTHGSVFF